MFLENKKCVLTVQILYRKICFTNLSEDYFFQYKIDLQNKPKRRQTIQYLRRKISYSMSINIIITQKAMDRFLIAWYHCCAKEWWQRNKKLGFSCLDLEGYISYTFVKYIKSCIHKINNTKNERCNLGTKTSRNKTN